MLKRAVLVALALTAAAIAPFAVRGDGPSAYPWPRSATSDGGTVASRFQPPDGYARVAVAEGSFGAWLRGLPLLQG